MDDKNKIKSYIPATLSLEFTHDENNKELIIESHGDLKKILTIPIGGGSGNVEWGYIEGDINDQLDLMEQFNLRIKIVSNTSIVYINNEKGEQDIKNFTNTEAINNTFPTWNSIQYNSLSTIDKSNNIVTERELNNRLVVVSHDTTLTGDGTTTNPLSVVSVSTQWGNITGDLKNQLDLMDELEAKLSDVAHDSTLTGNGTSLGPLSVVNLPKSFRLTFNNNTTTFNKWITAAVGFQLSDDQLYKSLFYLKSNLTSSYYIIQLIPKNGGIVSINKQFFYPSQTSLSTDGISEFLTIGKKDGENYTFDRFNIDDPIATSTTNDGLMLLYWNKNNQAFTPIVIGTLYDLVIMNVI